MPELPEVETIRRQLKREIVGKTIKRATTDTPKMVRGNLKAVQGKKVEDIDRRAKILIWRLAGKKGILFHLKLTGQLIFVDATGQKFGGGHPVPPLNQPVPNKTTHITFEFSDGSHLYFNDVRKFGWIMVGELDKLFHSPEITQLGIEPLSREFTEEKLKQLLARKKTRIKQLLMDQNVIAGIGNLYSDEILWQAKIAPTRPANQIKPQEVKVLYRAIKEILQKGIEAGGASDNVYVDTTGRPGTFMRYAHVYHQKKCSRCGGPVKTAKLGGRTAHWCPRCQV